MVESDDDVSEGEFIASCWNSAATPVRSALKSPDKASEVFIKITLELLYHHKNPFFTILVEKTSKCCV